MPAVMRALLALVAFAVLSLFLAQIAAVPQAIAQSATFEPVP